jgi:hypothetical protein
MTNLRPLIEAKKEELAKSEYETTATGLDE